MQIKNQYTYKEGYLPTPRHRKLRYRDVQDVVILNIPEITEQEAPIALRVHNWDDTKKNYRLWNNKLWTVIQWHDKHCGKEGLLPLSELHWYIRGEYAYWNYSKEEIANSFIEDAKKYLIIDGVVYQVTGEPRYVSMTFGLGHNHGGTSLMIDNYYNPNISKKCYFNALEREKAIKFTKERAIKRGDTNDVDKIGESYNIEVLIPKAVKCNPQREHGDGDPFLNQLYGITESSSSTMEAGLLGLCLLNKEMEKE